MSDTKLSRLVKAIDESIAARRLYLLMDGRLDWICGPGTLQNINSPEVTQKIAEFSAAHGWSAIRARTGFVFSAEGLCRGESC